MKESKWMGVLDKVFYPVLIILLLVTTIAANAQSGPYWQHKQKGGLETYTKYKMGWPYTLSCATYQTGNPVKSSTIKRLTERRKKQYLRQQKRKRFVKRLVR